MSNYRSLLLVVCLFWGASATAQEDITVTGRVLDAKSGEAVIGATVYFINVKDSLDSKFGTTDVEGKFTVKNMPRAFYKLEIRSIGYKTYQQVLRITQSAQMAPIALAVDVKQLDEIVVEAEQAVKQKGDTTVYRADSFKTNADATAADLVRKLPGMVITGNGVEVNGETINQVLVDGKRFFGQDPLLALNTLPAEVVNEVEVYDQKSESARQTGFDDGNTVKTMNVVTKEGKRQGEFGKFTAGTGTDSRYLLEGNLNSFKKNRQLTFLGLSNNINKTEFSASDITGAQGGSRGGGRFFGGQQSTPSGITTTNSYGVNYSNSEKDKWQVESSYFYDRGEIDNRNTTQRELFIGSNTQEYDEENTSKSINENHRLNLRTQYQLDESNSLLFIPSFTFQQNESYDFTEGITTNEGAIINQTTNNFSTLTQGYNSQNNLIYTHKFKSKTGRTFSVDMDFDVFDQEGDNTLENVLTDFTTVYQNTSMNTNWSVEPSYAEPVGTNSQVQFSYQMRRQDRTREITALEFLATDPNNTTLVTGLSGDFESIATSHQPTLSFNKRSFSNFFTASLAYQRTELQNRELSSSLGANTTNFQAVLPSFFGRIPLTETVEVFVRYSTQTALPSAVQLQEVVDNSNPLFLSVGNQDLDQSYSHSFFVRIGKNNVKKNTSIANLTILTQTNNYIASATYTASADSTVSAGVVLPQGGQIATPVNLDGFWNARNTTTYSFVLEKLKLNVSANAGVSYVKNPGIVNGELNISETYNFNSRLTVASNISEKVDFNVFYAWNTNQVENSLQERRNSRFLTHTIGGSMNITLPANVILRSDMNYQYYDGISDNFNTKYALWNASIAKKFMKNSAGELTFTVFDILRQNQSITQSVTANFFEERQSLVLRQYFMVSMNYTIRSFRSTGE